jgi:ribonucleoside-diphosphate reductase alpha chain
MRLPNSRERLSNRRASTQIAFECNGLQYVATVSFFPDGRLAEIFLSNSKAGSHSDSAAKDSAVVASIALQYDVPLDVIRHALMRDSAGRPSSPLGVALDLLAESA